MLICNIKLNIKIVLHDKHLAVYRLAWILRNVLPTITWWTKFPYSNYSRVLKSLKNFQFKYYQPKQLNIFTAI